MNIKSKIIIVVVSLMLVLGSLISSRVSASNPQRMDEMNPAAVQPGSLTLKESVNLITWTPILGNLSVGYSMVLDPANTYEYIDLASLIANPDLKSGLHEFYFDAFRAPEDFWTYWDARGVNASATGDNAIMWDIINGELPMFYIKSESGSYNLVDGYLYQTGGVESPWRINGDLPLDTYHFGGWVTDTGEGSEYLNIQITFTKIATVSITPESNTLGAGGYVDVYIHLENVHDLYAVDVDLSFDPTVLEVVDLDSEKPGVNLEPISTMFDAAYWVYNRSDNNYGTIQYAATLLNTAEPVDGAGDIAKIRFQAKSIGTSAITITKAELSDRDGFLVGRPVTLQPATITTCFKLYLPLISR